MKKSSRYTIILELITLLWLGLLYNAFILSPDQDSLALSSLDPDKRIQAIEHERLSGLLIPVQIGLGLDDRQPGIGHLPGWNPYMGTGTPLVNDAFFYLFNPFMSLPVLSLGAVQGTKIAIIIGLLVAGVNMWVFARAIGLGGVARVTVGALYMMSGGIIAKFHEGHFQLGLSLAWPPLVFAGLWWTLHHHDRRAPVLMAVAFTLLFFSGNIYYTLHTILCCTIIVVATAISRDNGRWQIARSKLRRVAIGGLLGLGLVMIQFLPVWTVRDYVSHKTVTFDSTTGAIEGQYDLGTGMSNLITPWESWRALEEPPFQLLASVDYAYIGPTVFAFIIGLVALIILDRSALFQHRRIAVIALVLAVMMMIWGAGQTALVTELYRRIPLLAEFRFLGRAFAIAALWWLVLAGIGLDALWRAAREKLGTPLEFDAYDRARLWRVMAFVAVLWFWFWIYSQSNHLTRLNMVLNNLTLFNRLNNQRMTSFSQVMQALVDLVTLVLLADTLLLIIHQRLQAKKWRGILQMLTTRLLRVGLLLVALAGIHDVMRTNHELITFGPPDNNFGGLYGATLGVERATTPFPSIQHPFSPAAFDAYYSRVRNWGLNEGWTPLPLENDIVPPGTGRLTILPRWAIVSTGFGRGGTYELAQQFVDQHNGITRECLSEIANADDPCDIETYNGSVLYEIPNVLPYAFAAAESTLKQQPDTLSGANVTPAQVISHDIDIITLQATLTDTESSQQHYLIVQETHFPGWHAAIDGIPTETVTVGNRPPQGFINGFVGIPMIQGTHTYTLWFEPPGFTTGIIISALTVVIIIIYLTGLSWPSRPRVISVNVPPSVPVTPVVHAPPATIVSSTQAVQPVTHSKRASLITAGLVILIFAGVGILVIWWNQKRLP